MNKSLKKLLPFIFVICICFPCSGLTIKLGSLFPKNSPWDLAFRRIASEWAEISDNTIELRVYAGGIVGDEEEMIRKMRIGQLNAAALSGLGLNQISPSILTLYVPFLIQDDDEAEYVLEAMSPDFKQSIDEEGYTVISWIMGGWIYLFSKAPVVTPQDLMRQKLLIPPNDQALVRAWREAGFTVVELSLTDLIIGLQTNMVEAFYSTPIVASFDFYNYANNLCSMKMAPLIGGFIVSNTAWNRIPEELKPRLIESAENILKPLDAETGIMEQATIESMEKYGLNVSYVNEQVRGRWEELVEIGFQVVLGSTIPVDTYEKVRALLEEYRR